MAAGGVEHLDVFEIDARIEPQVLEVVVGHAAVEPGFVPEIVVQGDVVEDDAVASHGERSVGLVIDLGVKQLEFQLVETGVLAFERQFFERTFGTDVARYRAVHIGDESGEQRLHESHRQGIQQQVQSEILVGRME